MKVKAKQRGYYANARVKQGQEFFLLKKEDFSKVWMEHLSDEPKPQVKEKPKAKAKSKAKGDSVI